MISKKIAVIGLWGAGKTSLVSQFVNQVFLDKYHATLGVKMDTKQVQVEEQTVKMVLWDIAGAEDVFSVPMHYISGSAGYLLVLDGTRRESFTKGFELVDSVTDKLGNIPCTIVVNKNDLPWEVSHEEIDQSLLKGRSWISTSAKTGEHVENAFTDLARKTLR